MDVSDDYILMCGKATEIQEPYNNKWGTDLDYGTFIVEDGNVDCIGSYAVDDRGVLNDLENFIVLPTQDQLQDMINGELSDKIDRFYRMLNKPFIYPVANIDSEKLKDIIDVFKGINDTSYVVMEDESEITFIESCKLESMEQMWLSLVMKEKYNKTWNKETKEWIPNK